MSKLRLDLDALTVETFDTAQSSTARHDGTVQANEATMQTCEGNTCDGAETCWDSCYPDCGSYRCVSQDPSCTVPSCVWTCTTCNQYGCPSCGTCLACH